MKKSYLICMFVVLLSSFLFSQEKSSIQFTGGIVSPISSNSGLSGAIQYNFNLNTRCNLFVSADYSSWDQRYSTYRDNSNSQSELRKISTESDHSLSRIMTGVRYIVVEPAEFRLFLEGGIGYSYLRYNSYDIHLFNTPDGGTELLALSGRNADENLFNISTGIGLIHSLTNKFDILFEFKINTYLNAAYYGLYSSRGTFTGFNAGFNYKI